MVGLYPIIDSSLHGVQAKFKRWGLLFCQERESIKSIMVTRLSLHQCVNYERIFADEWWRMTWDTGTVSNLSLCYERSILSSAGIILGFCTPDGRHWKIQQPGSQSVQSYQHGGNIKLKKSSSIILFLFILCHRQNSRIGERNWVYN